MAKDKTFFIVETVRYMIEAPTAQEAMDKFLNEKDALKTYFVEVTDRHMEGERGALVDPQPEGV